MIARLSNAKQIDLIHRLLRECESLGVPIWLESGWAVDARIGRVTREHDDVDFAIPDERMAEFKDLLRKMGADGFEETDYGFLVRVAGVLLDCEPCHSVNGVFELEGVPPGSCPAEKEGTLGVVPVRCTSWQAILWDYFHYLEEVPHTQWPAKDQASYRFVRSVVGEQQVDEWRARFLARAS